MEKIRIIIADDHQLFRNGLKILLNAFPEFEVTGEASNGEEFLKLIKNSFADVALMDINMPEMDGIEATRKGLKICPGMDIIALSMYGEEEIGQPVKTGEGNTLQDLRGTFEPGDCRVAVHKQKNGR